MLATIATFANAEPPAVQFTWAGAVEQLPALSQYTPTAKLPPFKSLFAKLGGTCVAVHEGITRLGQGNKEGHGWKWELAVTLTERTVTIVGPTAIHGLDRVGDGRTFRDEPKPRTFVARHVVDDRLPLVRQAYTLEIACWGEDTNTRSCPDGGQQVCHRCTTLRILGGPLGGQKVIGDGVIRADLTKSCGDSCKGDGMRWVDFESLAKLVKHTPVVVSDEAPEAALFASKDACLKADESVDLAKHFKGVEPAIPPR